MNFLFAVAIGGFLIAAGLIAHSGFGYIAAALFIGAAYLAYRGEIMRRSEQQRSDEKQHFYWSNKFVPPGI